MKRLALTVFASVLLTAPPAQADFFGDLGDALNKLGHSIGDTARDVGNSVDHALDSKPAQPAQPAPQPPGEIRWNPPPPTTGFSGATMYTPPIGILPPELPPQRRHAAAPVIAAAPGVPATTSASPVAGAAALANFGHSTTVDDAPPPRRAPQRAAVDTAYIAPLPGFTEAPARPAASYSPVVAAASLNAEASTIRESPSGPTDREFALSFNRRRIHLSDAILRNRRPAPDADSKALLDAVAASLKENGNQRLKLRSESVALGDKVSEARRRSFDRAVLVKKWLEQAGVRTTQIDMDVAGAGNADSITLALYTPE